MAKLTNILREKWQLKLRDATSRQIVIILADQLILFHQLFAIRTRFRSYVGEEVSFIDDFLELRFQRHLEKFKFLVKVFHQKTGQEISDVSRGFQDQLIDRHLFLEIELFHVSQEDVALDDFDD
jgi:hypothetical protein